MRTFTDDNLIYKAVEHITSNYKIGYIDIDKNICFIAPNQYEPGQAAYNILNPDLQLFTNEIKELFKKIDIYTSYVETDPGELDHYNQEEKKRVLKAFNKQLIEYYMPAQYEWYLQSCCKRSLKGGPAGPLIIE